MILVMSPLLHSAPSTACPECASDESGKSDFLTNPDYWQLVLRFLPLINHNYWTQVRSCCSPRVKWPFRKCCPSPLIFQNWPLLDTFDILDTFWLWKNFGHFGQFWTVLDSFGHSGLLWTLWALWTVLGPRRVWRCLKCPKLSKVSETVQ